MPKKKSAAQLDREIDALVRAQDGWISWDQHEQEDPEPPAGYTIDYSRTETTEDGYRAPLVRLKSRRSRGA